MSKTYTAICYTDGAAWPSSRGFYGGGVHGYLYCEDDIVEKTRDRHNNHFITNLGYIEKEDIGKFIVEHINPSFYINGCYSYPGEGTNNAGELNGMLETIRELIACEYEITKIDIHSDSTYALGIMRHLKNGNYEILNDINKPNRDLIIVMKELVDELNNKSVELNLSHVRAHATNLGNNLADRMAFLGRHKSAKGKSEIKLVITPGKNYWKPNLEKDRLLNFKQLFFTNEMRGVTNKYNYVVMNYKKDVELGKKTNVATFGIVVKNEPIPELEDIIRVFIKNMRSVSMLSSVNMNELYSQHSSLYLELFGEDALVFNRKHQILSVLEENIVANAINPPGLANQAMTKTMTLTHMLDTYKDYVNSGVSDNKFRRFIDITDLIYEVNDKGKTVIKLDTDVKVLEVMIDVEGMEVKIPLYLSVDCIDRNQLKGLEGLEPRVTLVVDQFLENNRYLEYYTIVETVKNKDVGVYCNFYSNKVFFKKK